MTARKPQRPDDCWHTAGYFEWIQVFRALPLQPAVKCVGFAMATWADYDTGRNAHPGTENLMIATGYTSPQTIRTATAELRKLRLVSRQVQGARQGRRALADMYWLALTNDARVAAGQKPCEINHAAEGKPKPARKLSARAAATEGADPWA